MRKESIKIKWHYQKEDTQNRDEINAEQIGMRQFRPSLNVQTVINPNYLTEPAQTAVIIKAVQYFCHENLDTLSAE